MNVIQEKVLKRKDVTEMSERELLMELVLEKRRDETLRIIHYFWQGFLLLVILILLIIYGPKIYHFFRSLYDTVSSLHSNIREITETVNKLSSSVQSLFGKFGILN